MTFRFAIAALVVALATPALAEDPITRWPGAEYRPAFALKTVQVARMRLDGAAMAHRVELGKPTAAETAKLLSINGATGSALASPGYPQFIGFGREVAAPMRSVDLASLSWTPLEGGARVARIEVASAGAASIRVALRLPETHPDLTVRFAAPGAAHAMFSIPANTIAQATARFGEYWSPVMEGSRAAIEIEAGADAPIAGVTLEIARVSHLVVGAAASAQDEAKVLSDIGKAGSCNFDAVCIDALLPVAFAAQRASVGKLVFTIPSGATARCTGTLLNETLGSHTPYVFSANHCFESAYAAATLNVWWFFDASSCGSGSAGNYVVQAGGAALLGRSQDWDWALLRLNTAPPDGTYFSGWNSAVLPAGLVPTILHHPAGDLKKWSQGDSFAAVPVDFGTAAGGAGLFTRIVWFTGTTEGGSSGGALLFNNGTTYEVRGGLLGGDALCTNPTGSDYFSQFGAMLPLVRQYLTPDQQAPDQVVSVEYYNAHLNHYFMTVNPDEIAGLDSGVIVGWERTGFRFLAYTSPGPGRNPVCRFYRKPEFGDSHFFTADPAECMRVAVDYATEWVFENPAIYYVQLPNTATGACPAETKPIYRFLNTAEINHRFTAEQTVANRLSTTAGWIPEGYGSGPLYPVMCSPVGA